MVTACKSPLPNAHQLSSRGCGTEAGGEDQERLLRGAIGPAHPSQVCKVNQQGHMSRGNHARLRWHRGEEARCLSELTVQHAQPRSRHGSTPERPRWWGTPQGPPKRSLSPPGSGDTRPGGEVVPASGSLKWKEAPRVTCSVVCGTEKMRTLGMNGSGI